LVQVLEIDQADFRMKIENLPLQIKENIMSTYDSILEKGIEIGTAKGMEKGMERGLEKGIETKAIQVVLSAFDQEIPLDLIANITKMPLATVMQILKDNQRL
jgi:flagellar biosynthesis/type III secretory pathway protein FliH